MSASFKNPLEGYPHTVETKGPDGLPSFRISLQSLTPQRARLAHGAADTASLCFLALSVYALWVTTAQVGIAQCMAALLLVVVARRLLPRLAEIAFRQSGEIVMSANAVAVRRGRTWHRYNRLLDHRFALKEHDLTSWERREIEYRVREASTSGQAVNPTVYFGESVHVVLVYSGHRQDIVTVWGIAHASAIVERLQYCDDCLNKALSMGGAAQTPGDDWPDGPGGIK